MRLVSGPAGSGKTSLILDQLRANVAAPVRLLVPTATMAQHLQNQLAREGHVFRRGLIQTLSSFLREWVEDAAEVPLPVLYLITEDAARRVNRPEFARVIDLPGFGASLAKTIAEFAGAGCDSARLSSCLPEAPLAEAFLAVYREVDRELACRGLATRARRLQLAAERIAAEGTRGIVSVWLDGFHALPEPELALIAALGRHADLTLTLDDLDLTSDFRARLASLGFREERLQRRRAHPARQVFKAPGVERETEEIARRILDLDASGRPFREIGIVVRASETYVPVLRATLARFGIPARFYFDQELDRHPAVRFLRGAMDAMLSGWDHARTLAVLRLAPRFADSGALDRFDFAVREQMPGSGMADLRAQLIDDAGQFRPGADKLAHKLDSLAALEEWRGYSLHPKDWATRFRTLRNIFRPARPPAAATHELALDWRSQADALDAFDEALEEAALCLDGREISIEPWWSTVKSVLRLKRLRVADGRRNVVHVLSAQEARQWSLPVMFVCGMVEKQFPRFHTQDPFFPDTARCQLNESGIRVRTAAEFEREERALFESALESATMQATLSWPEFDARGETNLKSLFLEELLLPAAVDSRPVRPAGGVRLPLRAACIREETLLSIIRERTASVTPTSLESFLQCPFQHFANRILKLRPAPVRPEDRLTFLIQGNIVHEVLKDWWTGQGEIAPVFERVFNRVIAEKHVPSGYHTERLRYQMLDDLRNFAAEHGWERGAFQSRTEEPFELRLADILVSGKIDRLDTRGDGSAYVIDYKYSAPQRVKAKLKNENLLQAPLYLLAAHECFQARPEGMFYIGVKSETVYAGWSDTALMGGMPMPQNWLADTRGRALRIVEEIRSGRIEAAPADRDNCGFCDFRDACRVDLGQPSGLPAAEGA
ncbi:MAG TPA: PD-(D/E)XK nuclease family protein [Candidatus Acidoferrales bacterium]|nr:PD-(D/E)XK nuclease family protein [Candidatus Acidoferrales bacterium]